MNCWNGFGTLWVTPMTHILFGSKRPHCWWYSKEEHRKKGWFLEHCQFGGGKLYGVDGIKNVCKSVSFSQGMWSAIKDHISRSDHGLEWPWGHCSPWTMEFCHLLISGGSQGNAKKIILNFRCFGVAFALQTLINHMCHISSQICHETGDSDVWLSIICGAHGNYKYYNNFWKLTKLMHCISL